MTDGSTATVLVVDDEPQILELYCRYLEDDYRVVGASSGPEALSLATEEIDVVLLDRLMPELSGREVLAELRGRGLDCRVVLVTAVRPDVDIIDIGFDDYVVKPVSRSELRNVVDSLLQWGDYDELLKSYLQTSRKVDVLEAELHEDELAESDEYERLCDELEDLRRRSREAVSDVELEAAAEVADEVARSVSGAEPRDWDDR